MRPTEPQPGRGVKGRRQARWLQLASMEPVPTATPSRPAPDAGPPPLLSEVVSTVACGLLLVVLTATLAVTTSAFQGPDAAVTLLVGAAVYSLLALGATAVMAAGRMDLSGAAVAAVAAVLAGKLAQAGVPLLIGFVAGAFAAAAIGAVSGLLAAVSRPASFLVTLAVATVCLSLVVQLAGGSAGVVLPGGLGVRQLPLVVPGLLLAVLGAALAVIALVSPSGHRLRWLGGEGEAGTPVRRLVLTMVVVYACAAALAAGAGVLQLASIGGIFPGAYPIVSVQLQLGALVAALLGGASLRGGRGSGYGAVAGALVVTVLMQGMVSVLGNPVVLVGPFLWTATMAAALVVAVLLDELRSRVLPA